METLICTVKHDTFDAEGAFRPRGTQIPGGKMLFGPRVPTKSRPRGTPIPESVGKSGSRTLGSVVFLRSLRGPRTQIFDSVSKSVHDPTQNNVNSL